jgi:hypothetical protein
VWFTHLALDNKLEMLMYEATELTISSKSDTPKPITRFRLKLAFMNGVYVVGG